jgi:hypothetical protein
LCSEYRGFHPECGWLRQLSFAFVSWEWMTGMIFFKKCYVSRRRRNPLGIGRVRIATASPTIERTCRLRLCPISVPEWTPGCRSGSESPTREPSWLPRHNGVKRFPRTSAKSSGKSAMIREAKPVAPGFRVPAVTRDRNRFPWCQGDVKDLGSWHCMRLGQIYLCSASTPPA